ncbi:MAG: hypothetical protein D3925_13215 [Candidatus Electrothrix sp. AR5]|nr:hypothetical protein [Candidatus Electrothrix sp. AR5]
MYENSMLIPAMNRIYYAMFYAVQAVLARDAVGFLKHAIGKIDIKNKYIEIS